LRNIPVSLPAPRGRRGIIPEGIRWIPIRYHHRLFFLMEKKPCIHAKTLKTLNPSLVGYTRLLTCPDGLNLGWVWAVWKVFFYLQRSVRTGSTNHTLAHKTETLCKLQ